MPGADNSSRIDRPDRIAAPEPARPPVLQVVIEAEPGPDVMDALRGRLDRLGCGFPEVSDTADGGQSVSGLLSGLPSRDLVPVACRLLGVAGVRNVQASFLSPDGAVLAIEHGRPGPRARRSAAAPRTSGSACATTCSPEVSSTSDRNRL